MKRILFPPTVFRYAAVPLLGMLLCTQQSFGSAITSLDLAFSGTSVYGAVGSAEVNIVIDQETNTLTWTINNTSPWETEEGELNTPVITGFGFNLEEPVPGWTSWTMSAYDDFENLVSVGGNTVGEENDYWRLNEPTGNSGNGNASVEGVNLDFLPHVDQGHDGGLYNPELLNPNNVNPTDLADNLGGEGKAYFFTTATFVMVFDSVPTLLPWKDDEGNILENFYVRMKRVGTDDGDEEEGSLKLYGPGSWVVEPPPPGTSPVPEPTSLALFGVGFACCSGWMARRRRRLSL